MEASNCCQRRAGGDWGSNRGGRGLPFLSVPLSFSIFFVNGFHSLFLSVSHSWRARLCHQGMGTREPGSDRMTFQHLAVCRRSFSLRYFSLSFSSTFILLWLVSIFLSFSLKKKKISPSNFWEDRECEVYKMQKEREERAGFIYGKEKRVCAENKARTEEREWELIDCSQEEV